MTEHVGIYPALSAAQGKYPEVQKKRVATVKGTKDGKQFSYKYNYADLADCMTAIRPALAENGLSVTQTLEVADNGRMLLRATLAHASGEKIELVIPLGPFPSEGKAVQTWAGVLTYARRYSLTALVGLAVEEDDDANRAADHDDYDVADREPTRRQPAAAKTNGNGHQPAPTGHEEVDAALAAAAAKDPLRILALPLKERIQTLEWALSDATPKTAADLWLVYSEHVKGLGKPSVYVALEDIVTSKALPEQPPSPPSDG